MIFRLLFSFLFLFSCADEFEAQKNKSLASFETPGEGLPFFRGKDMEVTWKKEAKDIRKVLPFTAVDQNKSTVTLDHLKGRLAVVSFFYTSCGGICPMITGNLSKIQSRFSKDKNLVLISFSVTPEFDSPEKLKEFALRKKIHSSSWHLLTGNKEEIYHLARTVFNADNFSVKENRIKEVTGDDFLHSENVYLVDQEQRIRGVYNGRMPSSIQELAKDIETLKKDEPTI
ncbi:SCO family protein [Leptospira idonii]|uniref:SCO family protein n=1 Tax=Leptospira idonii TaxID=1193500 RepID=A0A4R9M019_9LEPT|nr:SCO family protein [Leptospira idonii]TGN19990.1 SCO family protein [Leptospira idonii]